MSRNGKAKRVVAPITPGYVNQLLISAFEDYTAARTLLKQPDHVWQGTMLGSMAIEKYIKSLLAMKGISLKEHLSNYERIKQKLKEANLILPYEPNPSFIGVLSKSYKFRYSTT